ncbi:MAG: hypothetical protein ACLU9S_03630 [Oscillospiraceae bacterium]
MQKMVPTMAGDDTSFEVVGDGQQILRTHHALIERVQGAGHGSAHTNGDFTGQRVLTQAMTKKMRAGEMSLFSSSVCANGNMMRRAGDHGPSAARKCKSDHAWAIAQNDTFVVAEVWIGDSRMTR